MICYIQLFNCLIPSHLHDSKNIMISDKECSFPSLPVLMLLTSYKLPLTSFCSFPVSPKIRKAHGGGRSFNIKVIKKRTKTAVSIYSWTQLFWTLRGKQKYSSLKWWELKIVNIKWLQANLIEMVLSFELLRGCSRIYVQWSYAQ